jgi:RNA polymerase sigma-70 factor (ECF subfamily)
MAASEGERERMARQATPLSLLERVRARDAEAWSRLVALYQPLVLYWCRRGGLHGPDAEDVAQEVFAGAAAGLEHFRRDQPGDTFTGWLRGIAHNHIVLHFRRNRGRAQAEGGSDAWRQLQNLCDPDSQLDAEETAEIKQVYRRALEQARGDYEGRTWEAFWQTAIEGQSSAAVASQLGMTPAAVRQAKSRVLRRLKQEMGELLS